VIQRAPEAAERELFDLGLQGDDSQIDSFYSTAEAAVEDALGQVGTVGAFCPRRTTLRSGVRAMPAKTAKPPDGFWGSLAV